MDISEENNEQSFKSLKDFTDSQKSQRHENIKNSMDEMMIVDSIAADGVDDTDLTAHVGGEHLGFQPDNDGGIAANITSDVG